MATLMKTFQNGIRSLGFRSLLDSAFSVTAGTFAHFQQESNWSSIFSPHFGQFHIEHLGCHSDRASTE
jgi:hypothetical protein